MKKITKILLLVASAVLAVSFLLNRFQSDRTTRENQSVMEQADQKSYSNVQKESPLPRVVGKTQIEGAAPQELSPVEVRRFVAAVDHTFSVLVVAGVNEDEIDKHLSSLNERKEAGVRALVRILTAAPKNEQEVRPRISMVDYLLYRARWDEWTRAKILAMATSEVPEEVEPKLKGAMLVERAEIVGRIAAIDWNSTSQSLASLKHPSARRVAAAEAVFALASQGISIDEARKKVQEVVPDYAIASQGHSGVK